MNNDRASSFLCSFQTFQTFNVVCTRAQVHCATRDTEHLPGGVQPNLQYVTWYRTVPRYICRRLAWATLPRALFPEGTDRRPFLLQRVVFFLLFVIQLNQPKLLRQSKKKRESSSSFTL